MEIDKLLWNIIGDWIVGEIGSAIAVSHEVEYKIYSNSRRRYAIVSEAIESQNLKRTRN